MIKNAGVAVGAGLVSALLFAVSATGGLLAVLLSFFTALPLVIATLGYGQRLGLLAAAVGSAAVAAGLGPVLGGFYAASFALPAWWLSFLIGSARRAPSGAADGAGPAAWRPLGTALVWAVAASSAVVLASGLAATVYFGGYGRAVEAAAHALTEALAPAEGLADGGRDLAPVLARALPLAVAVSTCLMLLVNLWVGARVAQVSRRLARPWPNVPDGLRLPRPAALILAAGAGLAFAAGLDTALGAAAATVAAPLGLVFALQGLGTVHVLTRGFPARPGVLLLIYLVTLLLRPSALALALLGVIDCLGPLRSRRSPPNPPTTKKGLTPWT